MVIINMEMILFFIMMVLITFYYKGIRFINLQPRPASDGAFDDDFTVEAVSVDRGFETANTPFTNELTVINAAKVINGDDTSMDFATDGASKSLNVNFCKSSNKTSFYLTHTDAANNKFTIDFTNHDGTSTDLVSVLVTGASVLPSQIRQKYYWRSS